MRTDLMEMWILLLVFPPLSPPFVASNVTVSPLTTLSKMEAAPSTFSDSSALMKVPLALQEEALGPACGIIGWVTGGATGPMAGGAQRQITDPNPWGPNPGGPNP